MRFEQLIDTRIDTLFWILAYWNVSL